LDFEDDITELHPKKRGRPLLVGAKLDTKVQKCVTVLRDNGAVIKSQIVIAAAKGIIIGNDKILLAENDGSIDISKTWGKSHLKIMNYVKRRSSTACKYDKIENFDQLKDEFCKYSSYLAFVSKTTYFNSFGSFRSHSPVRYRYNVQASMIPIYYKT
jgi:hypothetical protein